MGEFTISREIAAPVDKVWDALADFGNIYVWNPGVTKSFLTGDRPNDVGATRQCHLKPMGTIQERIDGWVPRKELAIHIYEFSSSLPVKDGHALFRLSETEGGTLVTIDYTYQPRFIGRLMGGRLRTLLLKGLGGLLKGLDQHVTQQAPA